MKRGYIYWPDAIIVRHSNIKLLGEMVKYADVPIINAMTSVNHPCEIMSDLYSISKLRNPNGYEFEGIQIQYGLFEAVKDKEVILTDSLSQDAVVDFVNNQITKSVMKLANKGAIVNPCPPFYRGEEVSDDVINSDYFVGYRF